MPIAIFALFLAAFCVGTTEFVIAGLLPEISRDLGISIPIAGYLISAYALGVAVGGPIITLATARLPRKRNLLLLMLVFIAGHAWCALAWNFEMLMAGRLIVALSHGSFFGVATVVAVGLVAEDRHGSAVAWLFAGITVANILGVPGGTAIGNWLGWRATFWVVGASAVAVTVGMMLTIPRSSEPAGSRPGLGAQVSALAHQTVLFTYLTFALMLIGFWSLFTFIAPHLLNVAAISQQWLPVMLLLFGIGATLGTVLGGRLADRWPTRTLVIALPVQSIGFIAVAVTGANPIVMGVVLFFFGAIMFLPGSAIVNRVLTGAAKAPDLASTLIASAANIGIALGAIVGAQLLSAGFGYERLPWTGIIFTALAAGTMLFSLNLQRRTAATSRP